MLFFCFAVFSSLLIVEFRKNKHAAPDACWQADVTVTLIQEYVRNFSKINGEIFENERPVDGQADFSFFMYSFFCFAVFSSLLIVEFRKNKHAAPDACWQADVTVTLIQEYVRNFSKINGEIFENERPVDGQADFSFLCTLYVLSQCVY